MQRFQAAGLKFAVGTLEYKSLFAAQQPLPSSITQWYSIKQSVYSVASCYFLAVTTCGSPATSLPAAAAEIFPSFHLL